MPHALTDDCPSFDDGHFQTCALLFEHIPGSLTQRSLAVYIAHRPHRVDTSDSFRGLSGSVIEPPAFVVSEHHSEPFRVYTKASFLSSWHCQAESDYSLDVPSGTFPMNRYIREILSRVVLSKVRLDLEPPLQLLMNAAAYQVFPRSKIRGFQVETSASTLKSGLMGHIRGVEDAVFWTCYDRARDIFSQDLQTSWLQEHLSSTDTGCHVQIFVSGEVAPSNLKLFDEPSEDTLSSEDLLTAPHRAEWDVPWTVVCTPGFEPRLPVMPTDIHSVLCHPFEDVVRTP